MLDQRSKHILKCIVDCYLETGEPVSSRTISKMITLSPATIRNIMANLEDDGLLFSSHSSAGRTPTTKGVNMFIEDFDDLSLQEQILNELSCLCDASNTRPEILEQTTERVSDLTNSIALSIYHKDDIFVEHVEIRQISNDRLLLIIVLSDGNVKSYLFKQEEKVSTGTIAQATEFLNKIMFGKSLSQVKSLTGQTISLSRNAYDYSTALLIKNALNSDLSEDEDNYFIVKGEVNIFNNVETINQLNSAKKIVSSEEIKNAFLNTVNELKTSSKCKFYLGEDSLDAGCSLVLSPCLSYNGEVVGAIGIVCHTKTNYKRLLPVLGVTSKLLSKLQIL